MWSQKITQRYVFALLTLTLTQWFIKTTSRLRRDLHTKNKLLGQSFRKLKHCIWRHTHRQLQLKHFYFVDKLSMHLTTHEHPKRFKILKMVSHQKMVLFLPCVPNQTAHWLTLSWNFHGNGREGMCGKCPGNYKSHVPPWLIHTHTHTHIDTEKDRQLSTHYTITSTSWAKTGQPKSITFVKSQPCPHISFNAEKSVRISRKMRNIFHRTLRMLLHCLGKLKGAKRIVQ